MKCLKGSESSENHARYPSKVGREKGGEFVYSLFGCVLPAVQKWNTSNVSSLCECMTFPQCFLCLYLVSVHFVTLCVFLRVSLLCLLEMGLVADNWSSKNDLYLGILIPFLACTLACTLINLCIFWKIDALCQGTSTIATDL